MQQQVAPQECFSDSLNSKYQKVEGDGKDISDLFVMEFPVTNRLFEMFILYLEGGFDDAYGLCSLTIFRKKIEDVAMKHQWGEDFSPFLRSSQYMHELFRSLYRNRKNFNESIKPVVGINFYAAKAYCLWLSLLHSEGEIGEIFRLPRADEWRHIASGNNLRTYPWGNEPPYDQLAHYEKRGNDPMAYPCNVGEHLQGGTPDGIFDLAGNVKEWTSTQDENGKNIVCGACWFDGSAGLKNSSFWEAYNQALRVSFIGFRVVANPDAF